MKDLSKDLLKGKLPMTESEIVAKVKAEYDESKAFTDSKREVIKRREKLYLGTKDQEDKLYVRLVYSTIDTLSALEASDERSVIFAGRKIGMDDYADNINNKAKFDYEQMNCFSKKYQVRWDKYMTWVGIEVMDSWDNTLDVPTYKVISAAVRCPDWFADVNTWPRYHWFEFTALRMDIEDDERYFNIDQTFTKDQVWELEKKELDAIHNQRSLASPITTSSNDLLDLYYHYTTIKWVKYLAVLSTDKSVLVRFEEIPAMTDIEKKDKSKIEFPVIVRHFRPLRWDPYGISVPDLLEDKESMIQLFHNLRRIKTEHQALWDLFMFDPDKVDISSVQIPDIWPKYLPVTWMGSQQYPVFSEVPKWQSKQDEYNIVPDIQSHASLAVGMDSQTMWLTGDRSITATENQRVQANANLRLMLWIRFDNEAEKKFWLRWYKYNIYFFNKEKFFRLNDSVWEVFYSVKKKDFKGITDIDVEIKSKAECDTMKEKEKLWFMALADIILSSTSSTEASKNFALREMLRLNDIPKEKVNMMIKPTMEELNATDDLALLNNNELPWKIRDMKEDHRTYIMIYNRAFETDAKWSAIQKRMQALKLSWQDKELPTWATGQSWSMWAMGNMITNDMMQQSNKTQNGATSLQDIKQ